MKKYYFLGKKNYFNWLFIKKYIYLLNIVIYKNLFIIEFQIIFFIII